MIKEVDMVNIYGLVKAMISKIRRRIKVLDSGTQVNQVGASIVDRIGWIKTQMN